MYTHVIFDLDGTLLNTIDDLTDAGNHVCAAHGWPTHTVEQFKRMVGNGIPTLVSRLAPEGTDEGELAAALAEFSAWYDAHKADKTAPYGGVPQVVDALKAAGVTVAVLSNKAHALAESVVEGYYPGVFDAVQGALPDVPVKPDPTLLNKLMEQLGADRAHTLFVGDSNVDIQTGKNGGLATCGVLWGFRSRRELELAGADHIVEHPGQMAALVTGTELLMPGQTERAAQLLRQGKLVIGPGCRAALQEFQLYCWDEKAAGDRVRKEHDHAMDEIRYFAATVAGRAAGASPVCAGSVERRAQ